jgi:thiol:disulfide interchange protein DsbD
MIASLRRLAPWLLTLLLSIAGAALWTPLPAQAAVDESDLLPVDQAFVLTTKATSRGRIEFTWKIAPGYYLYRHRMGVAATDGAFKTNPLQLPDGIHKHDEFFGDVQIYHGTVTAVQTGAAASGVDAAGFAVKYQGCADAGVCYPPQQRAVHVALPPDTGIQPAPADAATPVAGTGAADNALGGLLAAPTNSLPGNPPPTGGNALPLPAEQAFGFEAIVDTPNRLLLRFTPAKGYYLYRDKTTIALKGETSPVQPGQPQWPPAQQHQDEHFGDVAVYFDQVDVPLPLQRASTAAQRIVLTTSFQGCQDNGICYPPMQRSVTLDLPAGGQVSALKQILRGDRTHALPTISMFTALLLALAGGLILNLMPCVLPVLSLKALSLAQAGESRTRARGHALWYSAGVLVSFAALGALAIGLRQAGLALGWGFQLQQPLVIAALAYLMLAIGLGLSGVYQFGAGVAGLGQKLTERSGPAGDFFTGVLAVVVASPCTAPFMGTALAFAFTASTATAMVVFLALGLGLALPFLLIGFVPALASRLPRPGAWMETFKQVLAFPMYLTAAWLVSVLAAQRGSAGVLYLLVGAVLLAFGLWWWERGRYSRQRLARPLALLVVLAALLPLVAISRLPAVAKEAAATGTVVYSADTLSKLRAQHRVVFVDMTADWCVSCKVNEKVVLSRPAFHDAMTAADAVFMVGDYTSVDPAITAFLDAHHAVGVPLYVVYPRSGGEGEVLPNILTQGIVGDALSRAAAQ